MTNNTHISVLLEETMQALHPAPGKRFIDATLGFGGHSLALVQQGSEVLSIDGDQKMIVAAKERFKTNCPTLVQGNFKDIQKIGKAHGFTDIDGVLFDLGISNLHYTDLARGFSFKNVAEPLDMRIEPEVSAVTAAILLNSLSESQLETVFEPILGRGKARRISKWIVAGRVQKPYETVGDLTAVIYEDLPEVFLALRIAVNSEFEAIEEGLTGAFSLLKQNGRVVVISFHSLEDKIVTSLFKKWMREEKGINETEKPIIPSEQEISKNPKARSAIMRVFQKS